MNQWVDTTCGFPQLDHGHLQCFGASSKYPIMQWLTSWVCFQQQQEQSFSRQLVSMCRKLAQICGPGRDNRPEHLAPPLEKQKIVVHIGPGSRRLREGIQA